MTALFNWLILIAFGAGMIVASHWVVKQSTARWRGPKTIFSRVFLYALTVSSVTGISFVAVLVLYNIILIQGEFLELVGLFGVLKFLLIFAGVWYAMVIALRPARNEESRE